MRDKVTLIILIFIIILLTYVTLSGISIGDLKILSLSEIKEKNNQLNLEINEASVITGIKYPESVEALETTFNKYKIQKQKYEEIEEIAEKKDINKYETKQYDIVYLWRVMGKLATTKNLILSMDVQKNASNSNLFNLNFTVTGTYVNIIEFIEELENNSDLYFRIYNFKMTSSGGNGYNVASTFTVKDININPATLTTTI